MFLLPLSLYIALSEFCSPLQSFLPHLSSPLTGRHTTTPTHKQQQKQQKQQKQQQQNNNHNNPNNNANKTTTHPTTTASHAETQKLITTTY